MSLYLPRDHVLVAVKSPLNALFRLPLSFLARFPGRETHQCAHCRRVGLPRLIHLFGTSESAEDTGYVHAVAGVDNAQTSRLLGTGLSARLKLLSPLRKS